MKYAAMIEYGTDKDRLEAVHPAHRAHLHTFLENGQLRAAGPFSDDAGPVWVLDADSAEEAERIVEGDPLLEAEAITSWTIRPTAYWSAQDAKGAK
ncbi:YciI family protein [Lichenibacterium ramalinae]|nr:YciI family protein [Lichenibacterium ramalinae]